MGTVTRRADGRLSKAIEIAGGALRIPANPTRAGVFTYRRDGKPWRELRPLDEVMRADSLASLQAAPATDLHPREGAVRLDNRKHLGVGHVGDNVRADESDASLVAADIIITDKRIIDLVRQDERSELSCGYTCDLDETPGEHGGERYDAVQRNIRYNHVALLPRGHGRAGGSVALRLDSAGNEITPPEMRVDSTGAPEMKKIRIDGVDYDPNTPEFAQAFDNYRARVDSELATAKADAAADKARADTAESAATKAKADLAEANDPARIDSAVAARVQLAEAAKKIAPEVKLDGKTADEVRRAVLAAKGVKLDERLDGLDDSAAAAYVVARFDGLLESIEAGPSKVSKARTVAGPAARTDASGPVDGAFIASQLREDADDTPEWMKPTSIDRSN